MSQPADRQIPPRKCITPVEENWFGFVRWKGEKEHAVRRTVQSRLADTDIRRSIYSIVLRAHVWYLCKTDKKGSIINLLYLINLILISALIN
jgi:hypothetical protein